MQGIAQQQIGEDEITKPQITLPGSEKLSLHLNVSTILLLAVNQSDFNKNVVLAIIYRLKSIVPSSW
ncbi:MAG: hypothetical protein ACFFCZ_28520 [Promethearchaeota archaeon]